MNRALDMLRRLGLGGSRSRAAVEAACLEAAAEAVKADRTRWVAIMALPEAKGRKELAACLFEAEMSIGQIKATLAAAPIISAGVMRTQGEEGEHVRRLH